MNNHLDTYYIITGECDDKEGDGVTNLFLITCIVIACIITCIITAVITYCITCLCCKCSSKRRSNRKNPPKGGVAATPNGVSTGSEDLIAGSGKLDCGSIGRSIINKTGTKV